MNETLIEILAENERRRSVMFAPFNPITGLGSIGERVPVSIPDFPIPSQWLPPAVASSPLVKALIRHGGVDGFLRVKMGVDPSPDARQRVIDRFVRLRCRHDFPFWAASFVYIKNKGGGADILFRLTFPQRIFVERLEALRLAGRPIRIIMLKARQWGGSTTSQMYMAWLQMVHRVGLNSLIVSQVQDASIKIKEMFRRMINAYPLDMLHDPLDSYPASEPKLMRVGGSDNTQTVPQRNCTISVGTAEKPDSVRSGDYSLVHCSEVGLWKATDNKKPEDIVRSACSGVLFRPYTMIVYESTANGVGNFFHGEYTAAKDPKVKSQFEALFISWFDIELYQLPFDSTAQRDAFAQSLIDGALSDNAPSDREEPGRYLWWLWTKGASLEGIHWYIEERAKYHDHGSMAAEYPSDDVEAFVNSGAAVFDKYLVEALRSTCRPPRLVGDVYADADTGEEALANLRFAPDSRGLLHIWSLPEVAAPTDTEEIADRYLTVVDIGGRSAKADWSVIVVFDRLLMIDGDRPSVVAQWYGHIDMDLLAWKAAQIAAFYDNSLLVIESNTLETHDRARDVDGDQFLSVLTQIKDAYPNLYARPQSAEAIRDGLPVRYGFHTNTFTKPMIISTLVKIIREGWYVERDERCIDEYLTYEKKQNGAYGAIDGKHDDLLMTRAIGLHICFHEMPLPRVVARGSDSYKYVPKVISAASF